MGNPRIGKIACVGWLACGLAVESVWAGEAAAVNEQSRGITESVLHFCGPVDPEAAARLKEKIAQLVQGASEDAEAKLRGSDEYRKAYDSVTDFVGKVDERNARRFCSVSLAQSK